MKFKFFLYSFFAIIFCSFLFSLLIFIASSATDMNGKNTHALQKVSMTVPKTAKIGDEITIEIYAITQTSEKLHLRGIMLVDSTGAYDINTQLHLFTPGKEISFRYSLGLLPQYIKLHYKIPSHVCPEHIVDTVCKEVPTHKGHGSIALLYDPEWTDTFLEGEGYQGDGERLLVPIDIH